MIVCRLLFLIVCLVLCVSRFNTIDHVVHSTDSIEVLLHNNTYIQHVANVSIIYNIIQST